jgi:glycosyltransferase involved in cell wall biosynthesis
MESMPPTQPRVSLIIPVHNGGRSFRRALTELGKSSRRPDEVIVVADGCQDNSAQVARRFGAFVIEVPKPMGPAAARNLAAARATGEVLVFMDADVAFHRTTIEQLVDHLIANPGIDAVFGNYDEAPTGTGLLSRYKNLLQHYVHLHAPQEAFTFWAACSAIRTDVFRKVGGFDPAFRQPSIEDIELGYRLRSAGHRIAHRRDILATHLKEWTAWSLLKSDLARRAIPWTRLIRRRGVFQEGLNIGRTERLKVAMVWLASAAFLMGWLSGWGFLLGVLLLVVVQWLNRAFLAFLWQQGGWRVALVGGAWHLFYHWYCGLGFLLGHLGKPIKGPTGSESLDRTTQNA